MKREDFPARVPELARYIYSRWAMAGADRRAWDDLEPQTRVGFERIAMAALVSQKSPADPPEINFDTLLPWVPFMLPNVRDETRAATLQFWSIEIRRTANGYHFDPPLPANVAALLGRRFSGAPITRDDTSGVTYIALERSEAAN